ncbi:hypothetical protein JCM5296_004629 [Sporobolomyces johnsonii]
MHLPRLFGLNELDSDASSSAASGSSAPSSAALSLDLAGPPLPTNSTSTSQSTIGSITSSLFLAGATTTPASYTTTLVEIVYVPFPTVSSASSTSSNNSLSQYAEGEAYYNLNFASLGAIAFSSFLTLLIVIAGTGCILAQAHKMRKIMHGGADDELSQLFGGQPTLEKGRRGRRRRGGESEGLLGQGVTTSTSSSDSDTSDVDGDEDVRL